MRCDKKRVKRFSSTGAKNEHTPGGGAGTRNGFVRHVLCRAHPQAAPVCMMIPALLEGACGRKERIKRSCIPGSKTVCQTVHTCVSGVNVQERSVRGELIVRRLSTGRVQIVHWRVPTVDERNRRLRRRFFGGAPKNLEDNAFMRYHQMQVNLSRGSRIVEFSRPESLLGNSGRLRRVGTR